MSGFKYVEDPILGKGRAEFIGGGTGGESYVAGDGIAINGNTISATSGAVTEAEFKDLSDGTQSVSKDLKEARYIEGNYYTNASVITLLHFSDIHGDTAALGRIMAYANGFGANIDGKICTGDMVASTATQISSWWTPSVMTVIGNHDTATYTPSVVWNYLPMADRDSYYIAPFESNWGVTHTSGTSYYYKDYSTQQVRLIVMDEMLYMSNATSTEAAAQTSWLEGLLASAITGGLHVMIALHGPKIGCKTIPSSFTRYGMDTFTTSPETNLPDAVINAVAAKISGGLNFIGYLCGHSHQDFILDITGDRSQMAYCITCANVAERMQWSVNGDMYRDTSLDAFNLVTIDTARTCVKIIRGGGANIDCKVRPRETITINYSNGTVIDRDVPNNIEAGWHMETSGPKVSLGRFVPIEEITGATATLQAGHAYSATVTDSLTLNTETFTGCGLDAHAYFTLGNGASITAGSNLVLTKPITADTQALCTIKFFNGTAYVCVDTVIGAYLVSLATGTSDGSLYYGLTVDSSERVIFDSELDTIDVSFGGATVSVEKTLVGNGVENTILGGTVNPGAGLLSMENLSLGDVYTTGGTFYISDGVIVAPGGTVSGVASSGEDNAPIVLNGGTVNGDVYISGGSHYLAGNSVINGTLHINTDANWPFYGSTASISGTGVITGDTVGRFSTSVPTTISGVTIRDMYMNRGSGNGGGFLVLDTTATLNAVTITGCTAKGASGYGAVCTTNSKVIMTDCVVVGNTSQRGGGIGVFYGEGFVVSGSTIANNICTAKVGGIDAGHGMYIEGSTVSFVNSLFINNGYSGTASAEVTAIMLNHVNAVLYINGSTIGEYQVARIINGGKVIIDGTIYSGSRISAGIGLNYTQTVEFKPGAVWRMTHTYTGRNIVYVKKITVGANCSIVTPGGSTVAINGGTAGEWTATVGHAYAIDKETGEIYYE